MALLSFAMPQLTHARAVGDLFTCDGTKYQITSVANGNLTVGIYSTSLTGDVSFPATVADSTGTVFKVTALLNRTLKQDPACRQITSITLPEGVTTFYAWSLESCSRLTTLHLPSTCGWPATNNVNYPALTTITVAEGNPYIKVVDSNTVYSQDGTILYFYYKTNGTTVEVPEGVKQYYLISNPNATTLKLPASYTGLRGTENMNKLQNIEVTAGNPKYSSQNGALCSADGDTLFLVPTARAGVYSKSTIKHVSTQAFGNYITKIELLGVESIAANSLTGDRVEEIVFGPNLKEIGGEEPVYGGVSLKKYTIQGDNPYFAIHDDGVLYTKDYTVLIDYPAGYIGGPEYTTHPNCKRISPWSFTWSNCTHITITENVDTIGYAAFWRAAALQSVTFSGTPKIRYIGNSSFRECQSLTSINIPASVERIENYAFDPDTRGSGLRYVSVAANSNLQYIGVHAFGGCANLEAFQMLSPATHKATTLTVGAQAFQNCPKLSLVQLGRNLTTLGTSAFGNCTALESIDLFQGNASTPAKLVTIGANVFQNCGLKEIQIPTSVKSIGNEAFNSCQRLETVKIPAATSSIGSQAFLFCGKLKEIVVDKANPTYASSDGILLNHDRTRLMQYPAGKAEADFYTLLPPTITEIADSAFYYNRLIKTVTIPRNVTSIGKYTFALCPNLEQVNLLGNATTADPTAFHDMQQQTRLPEISLSVRNDDRFYYKYDNVWKQAKNAVEFSSATSENVSFTDNDGNEYFPLLASADGAGNKSYDAMLLNVTESQVVTWRIPEKVSRGGRSYAVKLIGDEAFKSDEGICEEVILPDQMNYIGIGAFKKATGAPLQSIFILNPALSRENFSTIRFETDETKTDYSEIDTSTKVYVKKSVFGTSAFKNAFKRYTQDSRSHDGTVVRKGTPEMFDYRIPGIAISNTYGTFSREFDVDLSDYYDTNGAGRVWAFVTSDGQLKPGTGSGNVKGEYYIRMHSINEGGEGDGTYIPAYTGVLVKAVGGSTPTSESVGGAYYYTIGEKDVNAPVTGSDVRMRGVYEKPLTVTSTEGRLYVMQGGLFRKLPATPVTIRAHRAYLEVPAQAAGAKLVFGFDDETVVTSLNALSPDIDSPIEVYDLQGRRVTSPAKGIYVRNGKKVIIK